MSAGSARFKSFGPANYWESRKSLKQRARTENEEPRANRKNTRPHSLYRSGLKPKTQNKQRIGECYGYTTHQRRNSGSRSSFAEGMDCFPKRVAPKRKGV